MELISRTDSGYGNRTIPPWRRTGCGMRPLISFLGSLWFIIVSVAYLRNMESIEHVGSVCGSSEGSKTAVKINKSQNDSHGVFHEYKFTKYTRRQGFIVAQRLQ